MFWVCLAMCGRALSCWKIQTLCCCKYGTTTGSTIHVSGMPTYGRYASNRAVCSLFLTVLSQTLAPVAFLSKRPNVRLERNLLRRDEVVRKCLPAAWFYAVCLIRVGPRRSKFAEICSVVDLLLIRDFGNAEQRLLPTCQRLAYRWLFHVAQTSFQADVE